MSVVATTARFRPLIVVLAVIGAFFVSGNAVGWTRSTLTQVDVTVEMARQGDSKVLTEARFAVSGGTFRGFDLAAVPGATLVGTECEAKGDDGLKRRLDIVVKNDGSARVMLANKESISSGEMAFTLVHRIDFAQIGALRRYAGRARFDWTPIVWDQGMESMTVSVRLPAGSQRAAIVADEAVTGDYEKVITSDGVSFKKFRAVRWYPMQLMMDFDLSAVDVPETAAVLPAADEVGVRAASVLPMNRMENETHPPLFVQLLPGLVALLGLLLMIAKSFLVQRAFTDLNLPRGFRFLNRTGIPLRTVLSFAAIALGLYAQWKGVASASVPAFCSAAALWIPSRSKGQTRLRAGGAWREMNDVDLFLYRKTVRTYNSRRSFFLDVSTLRGLTGLILAVAAVLGTAWLVHAEWSRAAFCIILNGILWIAPIWFSFNRAELPVDPAMESFMALQGWRTGLEKIVGHVMKDAVASLWVREDEDGPIEVRLRVAPPPASLTGLEIAAEVLSIGTAYRVRKVTVLRMEPGTEQARRLAACPNAAEHHLTPDLEEEIIVLRNRRGNRDAGLRPLKAALAII